MQIFQSSITKLVQLLLPPRLRSATLKAFARAAVIPIEQIRTDLLKKREDVTYWLGITPQVCYLEKALNDTFDTEQRRIVIENTSGNDIQLIHRAAAEKPVFIGREDSGQSLIIHTSGNYGGSVVDFNVNLNDVSLTESEYQYLKYIVEANKLADKNFQILTR